MKTKKNSFPRTGFTAACIAAVSILIAAAFSGCDRPQEPQPKAELKTAETETAKKEVKDYKANPTTTQKAEADRALASLDKEIAELEKRVADKPDPEAESKLQSLRNTRSELSASYTKGDYESVTDKVGKTLKDLGKSISNAAEATVDKVKDVMTPDKKD